MIKADWFTWDNLYKFLLLATVLYLLFSHFKADTYDFSEEKQKIIELEQKFDSTIDRVNNIESDVQQMRQDRKERHETITKIRAADNDSLRRAHLRDLLNRAN